MSFKERQPFVPNPQIRIPQAALIRRTVNKKSFCTKVIRYRNSFTTFVEHSHPPSASPNSDHDVVGMGHRTVNRSVQDDRVLKAILDELREKGASQLRLKRVAQRSSVSIGLISDHFGSREDLIAAAALSRLDSLMELLMKPVTDIPHGEALLAHRLDEFEESLTSPATWRERQEARTEYAQLHLVIQNNVDAVKQVEMNHEANRRILIPRAQLFVDNGLTAPGVTAVTFIRVVFGVLYGQSFFTDQPGLEVDDDDLAVALRLVFRSVFRPLPASAA